MEEAIYWQKLREELLKKSLSFLACEKILTEEQEKAAALAQAERLAFFSYEHLEQCLRSVEEVEEKDADPDMTAQTRLSPVFLAVDPNKTITPEKTVVSSFKQRLPQGNDVMISSETSTETADSTVIIPPSLSQLIDQTATIPISRKPFGDRMEDDTLPPDQMKKKAEAAPAPSRALTPQEEAGTAHRNALAAEKEPPAPPVAVTPNTPTQAPSSSRQAAPSAASSVALAMALSEGHGKRNALLFAAAELPFLCLLPIVGMVLLMAIHLLFFFGLVLIAFLAATLFLLPVSLCLWSVFFAGQAFVQGHLAQGAAEGALALVALGFTLLSLLLIRLLYQKLFLPLWQGMIAFDRRFLSRFGAACAFIRKGAARL